MTTYPFPGWRRLIFVVVLTSIIAFTIVSSVTQGTVHVRVSGLIQRGVVSHIFVKFNEVGLHTAGFSSDSGWVVLTNLLPRVDLVPQTDNSIPETLISARIQSGRFDLIRFVTENATVVVSGTPERQISSVSTVNANTTIAVFPNGFGDVLVLFYVDYSLILGDQPQVALRVFQVTSG